MQFSQISAYKVCWEKYALKASNVDIQAFPSESPWPFQLLKSMNWEPQDSSCDECFHKLFYALLGKFCQLLKTDHNYANLSSRTLWYGIQLVRRQVLPVSSLSRNHWCHEDMTRFEAYASKRGMEWNTSPRRSLSYLGSIVIIQHRQLQHDGALYRVHIYIGKVRYIR